MFILLPGATAVLIGVGLGAVPGLRAMAGVDPDELEVDPGVEGPGGDEAEATDVVTDIPLGRGARAGAEGVG